MVGTEKQISWASDIQAIAFGKINDFIEKMRESNSDWSETITEFEKVKEILKLETSAVKWINNRNMNVFQLNGWAKRIEKVSDSIVALGKAEEK